ncbi:MAG: V-type ATP synthase subunit E [Clostridia bacterium]
MSATKVITDRILQDATNKCVEIEQTALSEAKEIAQKAELTIKEEELALQKYCDELCQDIMRRSQSQTNLEGKKVLLAHKLQLIDDAYKQAQKVIFADESRYLSLIDILITSNAEDGETVYICSADKNRITQQFLDKYNLHLLLSKKYLDISGGILLAKKEYDKNLTLERIFVASREKKEAQVLKILFGD